jgi:D-aspartate ligase
VKIGYPSMSNAPAMAASDLKRPIGAVVIGGDYQGLGIVRSLGRHQIPVCVIDDEKSISRFSRYTTQTVSVPSLREEKEAVDAILSAGRRLGLNGWVLYPTRDETVAALARNRELLSTFFRVPTPPWETVRWAWDKRNTYSLAEELGIPAPRTWYISSVEDLEQVTIDPPFAVKPSVKEHFFYATKAKAWRANDRAELRTLFLRAKELVGPGEVMIQDLIPGDGSQQFAYCAFFKEGRSIGSMVVQRRRQHPPEFGRASTFVETIEMPLLEELSERFLRAIDYYGLVELEYKLDPRDGKFRLLDFNARTWGYHSLGAGAGVDFPYLLFADQSGESVEPCRGRAGVTWIRLITDVPTGVLEMLGGRQDWRAYLRSLKDFHVESVLSSKDPVPGLMELALFPYLCIKRGF